MQSVLEFLPEVHQALAERRPVVALESTIISHGLPYPHNLDMAREVEALIRANGAVPATIALMEGVCRVGLCDADLQRLATEPGVAKASLRDLPILLARHQSGATTVAATASIAEAAGISIFVTGGIGGVHRGHPDGAAQVYDLSADLTVLGRSSITVVCAGAKTVLDIPATLEVLETLGVTVLGYGTDRFPGFYIRDSGWGVDARVDSPAEAAAIIAARRATGLPGSVLLVNPVPAAEALEAEEVERHLTDALAGLAADGVRGKDVTPYLLERMRTATQGRSLTANLALIRDNARVGAQVAVALGAAEQA